MAAVCSAAAPARSSEEAPKSSAVHQPVHARHRQEQRRHAVPTAGQIPSRVETGEEEAPAGGRKERHDEEKAEKDGKKDAKDAKDAKAPKDAKDEKGKKVEKTEKTLLLKYGINHVTTLIETRKAKLVVIAHDVDPIEIVVWLPALCRKKEVPYCIVKGKARLGRLVHKKTATAVAITEVKQEDHGKLEQLIQSCKLHFNEDGNALRKWGGGVLGAKATAVTRKREKAALREAQKRMEK